MYGELWYSGDTVPDMEEDFRKAVMSLCDNLEEQQGKVGEGERIENIRSNTIYAMDNPDFKTLVFEWIKKANEESGWNFDITGVENLQLSKYREGQAYGWHLDVQPTDPMRKLTYNVVLNDDFTGGDFQFSWGSPSASYKKRIKNEPQLRIPGRMVVFPSYYYHRVIPVHQGTRYSLTAWATGAPFK
tara:strand:- start:728 stop:1288 length:561 start_codon:yes stop_codon:yes gene_type:complete